MRENITVKTGNAQIQRLGHTSGQTKGTNPRLQDPNRAVKDEKVK